MNAVDVIIVNVEDSEGATGLGFSYVLGGNGGLAAQAAEYLLKTFVVGHAVVPPRALWKKIVRSFNRIQSTSPSATVFPAGLAGPAGRSSKP